MAWEVIIGLETHAQLRTASKIFSGASTQFGAPPNTQTSAIDLALPGTLPVLNQAAVEHAITFGLATGATIAPTSVFARIFSPFMPLSRRLRPAASTACPRLASMRGRIRATSRSLSAARK
jgi:aspartyl-tRNA(Asn)/glutamyl-tRNA(Gln) amidotransferase subunit B